MLQRMYSLYIHISTCLCNNRTMLLQTKGSLYPVGRYICRNIFLSQTLCWHLPKHLNIICANFQRILYAIIYGLFFAISVYWQYCQIWPASMLCTQQVFLVAIMIISMGHLLIVSLAKPKANILIIKSLHVHMCIVIAPNCHSCLPAQHEKGILSRFVWLC